MVAVVRILQSVLCAGQVGSEAQQAGSGDVLDCLKVGVTFLANFLTMNDKNQEHVWSLCFPKFFSDVLKLSQENHDRQLLSFLAMLIYNGACASKQRR